MSLSLPLKVLIVLIPKIALLLNKRIHYFVETITEIYRMLQALVYFICSQREKPA